MISVTNSEYIKAKWWNEWQTGNFSWQGLSSFPLAGAGGIHGEQSLQEYWRHDLATGRSRSDSEMCDAAELEIAPDGSIWHLAHVPLFWPDGSPAKSRWTSEKRIQLARIIATRMASAQETLVNNSCFGDEVVVGFDGRAQLHGSILLDPPDHPLGVEAPIHVAATCCWFPSWFAASRTFGPGANFGRAVFLDSGPFSKAMFQGDATFENAIFFGNAIFSGAVFFGDVSFSGTSFVKGAHFYRTKFLVMTSFDSSVFSTIASFTEAEFSGFVRYLNSIFLGGTSFERSKFSSEASFEVATFSGGVNFESASFQNSTSFWHTKFETMVDYELRSGSMRFAKATFGGSVDFEGAIFPSSPANHSAAFLGARFPKQINFRHCGDHWVAALDEAEITGPILMDQRDEIDSVRDFDETVLPLARQCGNNGMTGVTFLRELEGGCRTIKVAMGNVRNEIMEQRFYRFQLRARREQVGVPRIERLLSYTYGIVADYGLSPSRPLFCLGVLFLFSSYIYAMFWNASGVFDYVGAIKSIEMAASRTLPFAAFEGVSDVWFADLEERGAYPHTLLCARLFASLQSLISVVLVFLCGLAVRRRFKVGE